ncbi:uncharacterized protein LOC101863313 [Aplysia californica]|uniref:Uncharacterized protein LOC101863313 n=1 Tax=Aplysia californica TaxID=6500 RepID=A0ABM0K960_APLCA|nr:uncharacterized protein LOC101863313 [Aplysia californica]
MSTVHSSTGMYTESSSSQVRVTSWQAQDPDQPSSHILLQGCYQGILELQSALSHMDSAGTLLTQSLAQALHNTPYKCVADTLSCRLRDVYMSAMSKSSATLLKEMELMISSLQTSNRQHPEDSHVYGQTLCHISLLFAKLKKQYFALCHNKMVDLVHSLLCLKGEDPAAGEVTKLVLKLGLADGLDSPSKSNSSLPNTPWGSPKTRKSRTDSSKSPARSGFRIMSLFERKTPPDERKSSFYVDVEEPKTGNPDVPPREGIPTVSVTAGSVEEDRCGALSGGSGNPQFSSGFYGGSELSGDLLSCRSVGGDAATNANGAKSQLATEEELESVINLLSGVGCCPGSPMQVIPEVPPQDPLQLTVPQIYRVASPASDTQLDEISHVKTQVHRRSEGCLDLSAVGRNAWPHQLLHHRASLPSVQIFSATGQRTGGYESLPPSPVPGYMRDTPSPGHGVRDLPSPSYFRHDPPSPFRAHHANTLGVGGLGGMRSNMLSPLQWRGGPAGLGGSRLGGSLDAGAGQHGTWPMYGGLSPMSAGSAVDASSWSGLQDCSDLSDDSSTEDQFFAVGKDLSQAIGAKDGSSDEEGESGQPGQAKNSSTWPPPSSHGVSGGMGTHLLEPPELYTGHRPIQMQWSDPMPSRSSMWPGGHPDVSAQKTSHSMQGFGGMQ